MKIDFKLPMNRELAEFMLRQMGAAEVGEAFCAAMEYTLTGKDLEVSRLARKSYEDMRRMIDVGRKRADAGKKGGNGKRFASSKNDLLPAKMICFQQKDETPPEDDALLLAGLDAFQ